LHVEQRVGVGRVVIPILNPIAEVRLCELPEGCLGVLANSYEHACVLCHV
jgi:hypothetical protein